MFLKLTLNLDNSKKILNFKIFKICLLYISSKVHIKSISVHKISRN